MVLSISKTLQIYKYFFFILMILKKLIMHQLFQFYHERSSQLGTVIFSELFNISLPEF